MFQIGDFIQNRYRVLSELGRGSYGIVYKVFDEEKRAELAMKLLIMGANTGDSLRKFNESQFKNEYNAGKKIKSPFVISSHEYIDDKKYSFFTMEYAQGGSVFGRMKEFVHDWRVFNKFAFYFYCGLGDIHRSGVIHRDIKSENILLDNDLHPKITDFGVSHYLKGDVADKFFGKHSSETFGTDPYIAPEQRRVDTSNRETKPITDIFSAGVMMYFLITEGRHFPFGFFEKTKDNVSEYIDRTKVNGWYDILKHRNDVPIYWQHILKDSLQANTHDRIQSADYIRDILQKHTVLTHSNPRPTAFDWDDIGLKVVVGEEIGIVFKLHEWMKPSNNGIITIGRYDPYDPKKNCINIKDKSSTLSRMQATIEYNRTEKKWFLRNGQFDVVDGHRQWKEPPTGTLINNRDIDRFGTEFKIGDEIILAQMCLTVINIKK